MLNHSLVLAVKNIQVLTRNHASHVYSQENVGFFMEHVLGDCRKVIIIHRSTDLAVDVERQLHYKM